MIRVEFPDGPCFGLIITGGRVSEVPPIAKAAALGKPVRYIQWYYRKRGAKVTEL